MMPSCALMPYESDSMAAAIKVKDSLRELLLDYFADAMLLASSQALDLSNAKLLEVYAIERAIQTFINGN